MRRIKVRRPRPHHRCACPRWMRLGEECSNCSATAKPPANRRLVVEAFSRILSNEVWAAAVGICERAEHAGLIVGNGHHMAQRLAEAARLDMLARAEKH